MYMKIHCNFCGKNWEVYWNSDLMTDNARSCPHCGAAKIWRETWTKKVVPAFLAASEANMALVADHADHNALFTVSFIPDHIFGKGK